MEKPTIGRIVTALVEPEWNNGADVAPAQIVRVWSEHPDGGWTVNVKVNLDRDGQRWMTSARLVDTEGEARAIRGAVERPGPNVCFWPERA